MDERMEHKTRLNAFITINESIQDTKMFCWNYIVHGHWSINRWYREKYLPNLMPTVKFGRQHLTCAQDKQF